MIYFYKRFLVCLISLFLVGACANARTPDRSDLQHRRFVLASVDGEPFSASRMPEMTFDENFRITGQMCNRFTGQGILEKGMVKASQMASTRMFCADAALNRVEDIFSAMMTAGSAAEFADNTLTLRQGAHTLVFTAKDRVKE